MIDFNAVILAITRDSLEELRQAIPQDCDSDACNERGKTPLLYASAFGRDRIAKQLLDQGANGNHADEKGLTPLMESATSGSYETASALLNWGANIDARDEDGETALFFAAKAGRTKIVGLLLERGAHVNHEDAFGNTALTWTSIKGDFPETIETLLLHGADVRIRTIEGGTALTCAIAMQHEQTALLLIGAGSDLSVRLENGSTPLSLASDNGLANVVQTLREHGLR